MRPGLSARAPLVAVIVPLTGQKISLAAFTDSTAPHSSTKVICCSLLSCSNDSGANIYEISAKCQST